MTDRRSGCAPFPVPRVQGGRPRSGAKQPGATTQRLTQPRAVPRLAVAAVAARATGGPPDDDVVTDLHLSDPLTDGDDFAGTLMPKHCGVRHR